LARRKRRKNALSAHLRRLFAATQVSNDFQTNNASFKKRGKIYRCYNQLLPFLFQKNVTKSARLQTFKVPAHAHGK